MTHSNYKPLFSVKISHNYFLEKAGVPLLFQPSESSIDLMTQYDFVLRQTNSGIALLCTAEASLESILMTIKDATEITFFDFDIAVIDPYFYSYTEIQSDESQLVYTSDSILNRQENGSIVLYPNTIKERNENRLGRLCILFEDLIEFCKEGNPVDFSISFDSRSTQWQYFIIDLGKVPLDEMSIESDSDIQFSNAKKIVLENGQDATLFNSRTLLPLTNFPQHKFTLMSNGKPIILSLASPDITKLQVDKSKNKTVFCSPIYVYL